MLNADRREEQYRISEADNDISTKSKETTDEDKPQISSDRLRKKPVMANNIRLLINL